MPQSEKYMNGFVDIGKEAFIKKLINFDASSVAVSLPNHVLRVSAVSLTDDYIDIISICNIYNISNLIDLLICINRKLLEYQYPTFISDIEEKLCQF